MWRLPPTKHSVHFRFSTARFSTNHGTELMMVERAKKPSRLPVTFTHEEACAALALGWPVLSGGAFRLRRQPRFPPSITSGRCSRTPFTMRPALESKHNPSATVLPHSLHLSLPITPAPLLHRAKVDLHDLGHLFDQLPLTQCPPPSVLIVLLLFVQLVERGLIFLPRGRQSSSSRWLPP